MDHQIIGTTLPVLEMALQPGESIVAQSGELSWMTSSIELHTSTVITHRNLPSMLDIYRFLREHGVDQVVFNVMQANGRANTYFETIFPSYTEISATAKAFLDVPRL